MHTLMRFVSVAVFALTSLGTHAKDSRLPPDARRVGVVFHKGADTAAPARFDLVITAGNAK
jgi:hypothetical protein